MCVEVARLRELGQADGRGRAIAEGGHGRKADQFAATDRDAVAAGLVRHAIEDGGQRGDSVVDKVERDLDEATARERDAEGAHGRQAAVALAHRTRHRARDLDVRRVEPDVVGHEDLARADDGRARPRIEACRARVGSTGRRAQSRRQRLVAAAADVRKLAARR